MAMTAAEQPALFVDTNVLIRTNVIATMLAYDIPELLTHNGADFRRFGDRIRVSDIV